MKANEEFINKTEFVEVKHKMQLGLTMEHLKKKAAQRDERAWKEFCRGGGFRKFI